MTSASRRRTVLTEHQRTAERYLAVLEHAPPDRLAAWAGGRGNLNAVTRTPKQGEWEEAYGWLAAGALRLSEEQHARMDHLIECLGSTAMTLHWAHMTRPASFLLHLRRMAARNPADAWRAIQAASPASKAAITASDLVPYLTASNDAMRLEAFQLLSACASRAD
jgi:hypothetical protein